MMEKFIWTIVLGLIGVGWTWLYLHLGEDSVHRGMFLFFSIVAAAGWRGRAQRQEMKS